MTRDERGALEVLTDFVRDWRKEDVEWKRRTDSRLRKVEDYVTAQQAITENGQKISLSRRAKAGLIISAVGVSASIVLGVVGLLT